MREVFFYGTELTKKSVIGINYFSELPPRNYSIMGTILRILILNITNYIIPYDYKTVVLCIRHQILLLYTILYYTKTG